MSSPGLDQNAALQLAAGAMPQTIGVIDLASWEFLYLSPRFEAVWGHRRDELLADARRFLDWVHPADRGRMATLLAQPVDDAVEADFRIVRDDGTVRWLHSYAQRLRPAAGTGDYLLGITEDVTDRRPPEARAPDAVQWAARCAACDTVVVSAARLGGAEMERLREHLLRCTPDVLGAGEPRFGTILRGFRVVAVDAP